MVDLLHWPVFPQLSSPVSSVLEYRTVCFPADSSSRVNKFNFVTRQRRRINTVRKSAIVDFLLVFVLPLLHETVVACSSFRGGLCDFCTELNDTSGVIDNSTRHSRSEGDWGRKGKKCIDWGPEENVTKDELQHFWKGFSSATSSSSSWELRR